MLWRDSNGQCFWCDVTAYTWFSNVPDSEGSSISSSMSSVLLTMKKAITVVHPHHWVNGFVRPCLSGLGATGYDGGSHSLLPFVASTDFAKLTQLFEIGGNINRGHEEAHTSSYSSSFLSSGHWIWILFAPELLSEGWPESWIAWIQEAPGHSALINEKKGLSECGSSSVSGHLSMWEQN